jgi:hypothetical protein
MKRFGLFRGFIATAMAIAFLSIVAGGARAADDTATITIHKAECPTGVGSQIFEKCHSNGLGGVDFSIGPDGAETIYTTDADGVIGPITIPAGYMNIAEDPATMAQYLGEYVYCRDLTTNTVLFDGDLSGTNGVHGTNPAGANVVCDWYDITPAADPGDTTGGTTTTTTTVASTLPSTGTGSSVSNNSLFYGFSTLLLLAAVAFGGAEMLRRRQR